MYSVTNADRRRVLGALLAWGVTSGAAAAAADCAPGCAVFAEAVGTHDAMQAVARSGTRLLAVGSKGRVSVSEDGGRSWGSEAIDGRPPLIDVSACPDGRFFLLDFRRGLWARDGDGGWERRPIDPGVEGVAPGAGPPRSLALRCDPAGRLWAVGEDSSILRSDDDGRTWRATYADHSDRLLTALGFVDAERVLVVGEFGSVLVSDDGGATWRDGPRLPEDLYPHALHVGDDGRAWCVANTGLIHRLDVDAEAWVREPAGTSRALFGVARVGASLVAVGAGAAAVARSVEAGSDPAWRPFALIEGRRAARDWRGVVALDEGAWIAVGEAGLAVVPGLEASRPDEDPVVGDLDPDAAR